MEMGHFLSIRHLVVKEKKNKTKSPVFVILNHYFAGFERKYVGVFSIHCALPWTT